MTTSIIINFTHAINISTLGEVNIIIGFMTINQIFIIIIIIIVVTTITKSTQVLSPLLSWTSTSFHNFKLKMFVLARIWTPRCTYLLQVFERASDSLLQQA